MARLAGQAASISPPVNADAEAEFSAAGDVGGQDLDGFLRRGRHASNPHYLSAATELFGGFRRKALAQQRGLHPGRLDHKGPAIQSAERLQFR